VELLYGTPVISITKGVETATLPIGQANDDKLWAAYAQVGRTEG
jgi:hypothetical protein